MMAIDAAAVELPSRLVRYLSGAYARRGMGPLHRRFRCWTIPSSTAGLRLHLSVLEAERPAGAIVFVPGTAAYALCYAELLVGFQAAGYAVVGLDPRGHGLSDGVRGDYTVDELVADTRAAIGFARQRFEGPIYLVGSSQGGVVALYTATADERIAAAVCHNIADLSDPDTIRIASHQRLSRLLRPLLPALVRLLPRAPVPISLYVDLSREPTRGYRHAKAFLAQDPLDLGTITLRALHSLASCPPPRPLESLRCPLLVLQPGDDRIVPPDYAEKLFARLSGSHQKLLVLPGLPHLIMTEHVAEVLPIITEWLAQLGPAALQ